MEMREFNAGNRRSSSESSLSEPPSSPALSAHRLDTELTAVGNALSQGTLDSLTLFVFLLSCNLSR